MKKIEILAPAGSMEALQAAVHAGADAVYMGGNKFGARAFANNPNTEQLGKAIDFVHLFDKKLYLTVNTLLKDDEFDSLYEMVAPLYEKGLDACIVQDLGVMAFLHRNFPDMDLHASTQMTLLNGKSANLLKNYGVTRFVPARELTIEEIKEARGQTELEMEVFVHGALCYCYSGQCLLSSQIGGRSGNRGMCAQPCRLRYDLNGTTGYYLSPKDICTVSHIPELIEAGIDSFKIEGRMKRKEYAAFSALTYRTYADFYEKEGKTAFSKQVDDKNSALNRDIIRLMDLYNRGGFGSGYLFEKNPKKNLIDTVKNNHYGVHVGDVIYTKNNRADCRVILDIAYQDVLEFRDGENCAYEYTVKEPVRAVGRAQTNVLKGSNIFPGQKVYRTKNASLLEEINTIPERTIILNGELHLYLGKPTTFTVTGKGVSVTILGEIPARAQNRAVTEEELKKRLSRTGETHYRFDALNISLEDNLFIPMGKINEIRRKALEKWESEFLNKSYRESKEKSEVVSELVRKVNENIVGVCSIEQLRQALEFDVTWYHLRLSELPKEDWRQAANIVKEYNKKFLVSFPKILPNDWNWSSYGEDGYLINSWDMLSYLREHSLQGTKILDACLYVTNKEAWNVYRQEFDIDDFNNSLDPAVTGGDGFVWVYGSVPVMTTKGCIHALTEKCDTKSGSHKLTNLKGDEFFVVKHCDYCYNTIYMKQPINHKVGYEKMRFEFTWEPAHTLGEILRQWKI